MSNLILGKSVVDIVRKKALAKCNDLTGKEVPDKIWLPINNRVRIIVTGEINRHLVDNVVAQLHSEL